MLRLKVHREGVTLSYLDSSGPGPVVVLLHGLAGSAGEMTATADALRDDYRVLALDQRGHGHSTRRPGDTSRRAYVDDVVALITTVTGGTPVTVVGQSMGAHTALLLAAWHSDLVERLVLLEGGVGGGTEDTSAQMGSWFASWPVPFASRQAAVDFLEGTATAAAWAQDLEERDDGFWPRFDADVMQSAIAAVAQEARWAEWQQVKAPTLLVQAERSYLDAAEVGRMLDLRPGTCHVRVPGAGHDVHLDQPQAWTQLLRHYLDTTETPALDQEASRAEVPRRTSPATRRDEPFSRDVLIRPYESVDAEATAQVFMAAIHETARQDYTVEQVNAWAPGDIDVEGWGQGRSTSHTFVACIAGEVVGFSDFTDDGVVDMLFVRPDAGRRGVARALVTRVLDEAAAAGHGRLETHASLTARPAFERFGFVVDAARTVYRRGQELRNFDMSIVLAADAGVYGSRRPLG